jgi:hypothetical protein
LVVGRGRGGGRHRRRRGGGGGGGVDGDGGGARVHQIAIPRFSDVRNLRLQLSFSGVHGSIPRPRALRSRDLCRLDVRKAAAGPRSTGAPSPRMRRAGLAAQRDDDTARRARPCACIRRYNPEEPPIPPPPAPCYTCATIAPRLIFSWRSTTLICYVVPPKPPSPPLRYASTICLQICTFGRFLTAPGPRSISCMLALFGAAPPASNPNPSPPLPLPTCMC